MSEKFLREIVRIAVFFSLLCGCGKPSRPGIVDLSGREGLSMFTLTTMNGVRDGDRLNAEAMFSDSASILTIQMRFRIGSPTTLESGRWQWARNGGRSEGAVTARSVTFLGGQDGPPSIGGTFDLLGPDGTARYRATIPVRELR